MFDSKFYGHQSMKLQLSYEINVWLCTDIANTAFNYIEDN